MGKIAFALAKSKMGAVQKNYELIKKLLEIVN
jgi:hypothetical protein